MKNKLYTELNRYNVFDIGGYQCSNGYRSALVSKDLMFKHGNFGFVTPTIGCKGGRGDPDCIVDFTNNNGKFTIRWKGGQVCEIVARKVELPQGIPEDELENLADIRLVDEKHSYIYDDGSAWLALDLDRIIGNKWHRKLLGNLKAYAKEQAQERAEAKAEAEEYEKQFIKYASYAIPGTVVKIADSCFSDCESLTYVTIPSSVKEIGNLAFFKCKGFETITIPDGVKSIGSDGFSYCEKVSYIFVPASVEFIGHHAFYGDLGCERIYMGAANEDAVETGERWLPKKSTRSLKDVEAVYGQERREG